MKKTVISLIALSLGAAASGATRPAQRTIVTPDIKGMVFKMTAPSNWTIKSVGEAYLRLSGPSATHTGRSIEVAVYVDRIATKDLAQHGWKPDGSAAPLQVVTSYKKATRYFRVQRVFEQSVGTLAGYKANCRTLGPQTYTDAKTKKRVPSQGPAMKSYDVMTPEYVYVNATIRAGGPMPTTLDQAVYAELATAADRVIASIRQVDVSKMTAKQKSEMVPVWYKSREVVISRRRDYYVKMQAELLRLPGWQVKDRTARAAGGASEKGLYVLDIVAPVKVAEDQPVPRIMIVMEGLRVGPLNKSQFLATLGPHVKGLLPAAKLTGTKEIYFQGLGFLAMSGSRYTSPTKTTVVRTYAGKDAYGRSLKIRAYTAGGMTMACHIIVVAGADSYEKILPTIDEVLNLVRIVLRSPSIQVPG